MSRDKLAQIAEVRARRGRMSSFIIPGRLADLKKNWTQCKEISSDLRDLVVIRAVTLLEVFTRQWVAEILDPGSPYVERAVSWKKDLKFETQVWLALHGKRVTLGELFSHQLSVNSLADVDSVITALLDHSLFDLIKDAYDHGQVEIYGQPPTPIVTDTVQLRKHLVKLFEVRHVLVHELPENSPFTDQEAECFLSAAFEFALAVDEVLTRALYGEVPLTQAGMNEHAGKDLRRVEQELTGVIAESGFSKMDGFQDVLIAFEAHANAYAAWVSGIYRPGRGSIAPLLFASEKESMLREFMQRLKERSSYLDGL